MKTQKFKCLSSKNTTIQTRQAETDKHKQTNKQNKLTMYPMHKRLLRNCPLNSDIKTVKCKNITID